MRVNGNCSLRAVLAESPILSRVVLTTIPGRYLDPEEVPEAGRVESWFPPGYPFPAPFTARLHSFHKENSSSPASCFPGSGGAACREWWTRL